jgi:hypothetical protein
VGLSTQPDRGHPQQNMADRAKDDPAVMEPLRRWKLARFPIELWVPHWCVAGAVRYSFSAPGSNRTGTNRSVIRCQRGDGRNYISSPGRSFQSVPDRFGFARKSRTSDSVFIPTRRQTALPFSTRTNCGMRSTLHERARSPLFVMSTMRIRMSC